MTAQQFCFLMVLASTLSKSLAAESTGNSNPCPPCGYELQLTEDQMLQAAESLDDIQDATDFGVPPTLVPLNDIQTRCIVDKFGPMFSKAQLTTGGEVVGEPTPDNSHFRVCPPGGPSYVDLQLGVNASSSPVQIIQLPDMRQWIKAEECMYDVSVVCADIVCMEVHQLTPAVVINLEEPHHGIHLESIKVQSCAVFTQNK